MTQRILFAVNRWSISLLILSLLAPGLSAQQSVHFTVLPFVQANGLVDVNFAGRWQNGPASFSALNTQFQAYPGVPIQVGSHAHSLSTFSRQNVPYFSRAPFIGGLFRNRTDWRQQSLNQFNFTITPVDPAGNPMLYARPRPASPPMIGFINSASPR